MLVLFVVDGRVFGTGVGVVLDTFGLVLVLFVVDGRVFGTGVGVVLDTFGLVLVLLLFDGRVFVLLLFVGRVL